MQRSAAEAAAGFTPTARQYAQLLPPPMQPAMQEDERDACIIQGDFKAAMVAKQGFEYEAEAPDAATTGAQKWGWVGRSVGEHGRLVVGRGSCGGWAWTVPSNQSHGLRSRLGGHADQLAGTRPMPTVLPPSEPPQATG